MPGHRELHEQAQVAPALHLHRGSPLPVLQGRLQQAVAVMGLAGVDELHGMVDERAPVLPEGVGAALLRLLHPGRLHRVCNFCPGFGFLFTLKIACFVGVGDRCLQCFLAVVPRLVDRLNPPDGVAVVHLIPGVGPRQVGGLCGAATLPDAQHNPVADAGDAPAIPGLSCLDQALFPPGARVIRSQWSDAKSDAKKILFSCLRSSRVANRSRL